MTCPERCLIDVQSHSPYVTFAQLFSKKLNICGEERKQSQRSKPALVSSAAVLHAASMMPYLPTPCPYPRHPNRENFHGFAKISITSSCVFVSRQNSSPRPLCFLGPPSPSTSNIFSSSILDRLLRDLYSDDLNPPKTPK